MLATGARACRRVAARRAPRLEAPLARAFAAGAAEEKPSVVSAVLNDWKYSVPLGILVAVPAITNEVLVLDAETNLTICFLAFCATMTNQISGSVAKMLDEQREQIFREQRAVEDAKVESIQQEVESMTKFIELSEEVRAFYKAQDDAASLAMEASNYEAKHELRSATVRKLDAVVALEDSAVSKIKDRMVSSVMDDVASTFANDKKVRDSALAQAIATMASPGMQMQGDVVGDQFVKAMQTYRTNYANMPEGEDELLVKLKQDVAAVVNKA